MPSELDHVQKKPTSDPVCVKCIHCSNDVAAELLQTNYCLEEGDYKTTSPEEILHWIKKILILA